VKSTFRGSVSRKLLVRFGCNSSAVHEVFEQAVGFGHADKDTASIVEVVGRRAAAR